MVLFITEAVLLGNMRNTSKIGITSDSNCYISGNFIPNRNLGLHRVEIHNMFVYIIRTLFLWHLQTSFLSQAFTSISYITVDNEMYEKPHNESIILTQEPALAIVVKDKITKLFDGLFNLSYPLEYLKFINTSTVEIEPDFLNGQEVYSLSIQENNIKVIQTYTFRNLKLTLIDLSRNGIQIVENLAFANLSNLEKICLEGNKLTNLNSKAYENLPKFLDLILMENYITQLGPSSLGFVKTRDFMLFLSDNRIANIHEDAFRGSNATNVRNKVATKVSITVCCNPCFGSTTQIS
ncbi:leucine-rich repeats and immunoglobulin-like domains protein 3 [Zophobas morio]|uniref:leucine-rich repeats and immunoglobulin-like domains protein 3 n=1 Tax=Zophobas morio TaxID=2755281 RepID=UPI0030831EE4